MKMKLPSAFLAFLEEHGIDPKVYDVDLDSMPRYFR